MSKKRIAKELRQVALDFNERCIYLWDLSDEAFDVVRETSIYNHIESSADISSNLRRMYLLFVAEWLES